MTDGTNNAGLLQIAISNISAVSPRVAAYGTDVGTTIMDAAGLSPFSIGLTTDPEKSGVVGTVTRSVFSVKFIIKY